MSSLWLNIHLYAPPSPPHHGGASWLLSVDNYLSTLQDCGRVLMVSGQSYQGALGHNSSCSPEMSHLRSWESLRDNQIFEVPLGQPLGAPFQSSRPWGNTGLPSRVFLCWHITHVPMQRKLSYSTKAFASGGRVLSAAKHLCYECNICGTLPLFGRR